jgi:hypothetical protein
MSKHEKAPTYLLVFTAALVANFLLAAGLDLCGIVTFRPAFSLALILTAMLPGAILFLGRIRFGFLLEYLPQYWILCYLVAAALLIGGVLRQLFAR